MFKRDVNLWNLMIFGFVMYGYVELVMEYFDKMIKVEGLMLNLIIFVGILSVCNYGGMVELGREYFDSMVKDYFIEF